MPIQISLLINFFCPCPCSHDVSEGRTLDADMGPEVTLAVTNSAAEAPSSQVTAELPTATDSNSTSDENDDSATRTTPSTTEVSTTISKEQDKDKENGGKDEEDEETKSAAERLKEYESRWKAIAIENSDLFGNSTSRDINIMHAAGLIKSGPIKNELHASSSSGRFPIDMPFMDALATCDTFECVKDAHMQPRYGARFNYPHFMILGWQKSATSSLYA